MTETFPDAQAGTPRSPVWMLLRLLGGWALVALLAYSLWSPGDWVTQLLAWVLLTILADEFGGWFGYIGALLGGLPFFAPGGAAAQWTVIVPLVGGALLALLLVKHSGGAFVLPFAGVIFALPLLVLARYGTKLDPSLTLPANETFLRTALTAMLAGLAFSFVRQLAGVVWRYRARRRATRVAAGTVVPANPIPAAPAHEVITVTPAPEELPVDPATPPQPGRHS
ncbi:hypothetical protein [Deinococcus sp. S9]|uniref:hypothetical protein n=1 Tax=Deinococcus sp. S9 TaxID=2545754 RepID=UPI001F0FE7B8|nr:hypothetical protein [Deinococcus sp. S9]